MSNPTRGVLYFKQNMDTPSFFETPSGNVSLVTRAAPIENRTNEDACGIRAFSDGSLLLAVCDGLGGHQNGGDAAKIALQSILLGLDKNSSFSLDELFEKIELAHQEIKKLRVGAGTTLVLAWVRETSVRFVSIGDSVGYIVSGQKNFKFKTLEQSPTGLGVEAGLLDEVEAMDHDESHVVLNALGLDPLRIEITGDIELAERDFVFLATDGLSGNLLQEEFVKNLTATDLTACLSGIVSQAQDRMKNGGNLDDLTMVLLSR